MENEIKEYLASHLKINTYTTFNYTTEGWLLVTDLLLDDEVISSSYITLDC